MVFFWCSPSVEELPRPPPITGDRAFGASKGFHPWQSQRNTRAPTTGTQATTHGDPILNHLNIPWRLAKYLSASITPFIYSTPHASSQSQFSTHPVNVFNGNLRKSCESGN